VGAGFPWEGQCAWRCHGGLGHKPEMEMSGYWVVGYMLAVVGSWLAIAIESQRLYQWFWDRHHEQAVRYLPPPGGRYPEKVLFFLRRRNTVVLRADPLLWARRQRLKRLIILGILLWVGGFAAMAIAARIVTM
jgi:hypothetical protein